MNHAKVKQSRKSSPLQGPGTRHAGALPPKDTVTKPITAKRGSYKRRNTREPTVTKLGNHLLSHNPDNDESPYQLTSAIKDVMDRAGLDDITLIEKYLKPTMDANEIKHFVLSSVGGGNVIEEREVIAWHVRQRALDMAFQLRGSYAPRQQRIDLSGEVSLAERIRAGRARASARMTEPINISTGTTQEG